MTPGARATGTLAGRARTVDANVVEGACSHRPNSRRFRILIAIARHLVSAFAALHA